MPKIHVNGAEYYYEIHGTGHPVVLISGYTDDHSGWLSLLEPLAKHFQVLIFDNRGTGQTKDGGEPLSADLIADDIVLLADKLGLEKPHIVGFSMGGTIAQSIATRYGHLIDRLILFATTFKWRQAVLLAFKSHLLMREKGFTFDELIEATVSWVYGEKFLANKRNIKKIKEFCLADPYPQSLADQKRQFQILETFDGRDGLSQIKAPTLVIHGTEDIIVLPPEAKAMASQIPNAKIVEFNCGHGVLFEAPNLLQDLFIQFLNGM